jgi:glycosyltransferase involved in cell wall biosynthesis
MPSLQSLEAVESRSSQEPAALGLSCKVLRVVTRLNVGGPSIHAVLLTRELAALGYQTTLVTGACEAADGDMSYLLNSNDAVVWIPEMSRSVNPWKNLRALTRLWSVIRRERPDIVHTHTAMAGCLGRAAAVLAGVPVVIHTFHGNSLRGYFSPLTERVFIQIERLLARRTDAICVVCEQQLTELSDGFRVAPRRRFRVLPLGLNLSSFLAMPPPALAGGPLRAGWFGRMVPIKNIPLLLEIVQATVERTDAVEFHVAGDGPERELVQAAARRFGPRLVWHGWQKDITPLVEKCHVLVQTSHNEGTPVALIQGMAAARPFLSTAAGGLVDMVAGPVLRTTTGCSWYANGILAEPRPEAFAEALLELHQSGETLTAMGREARLFAATKYSKETLLTGLDSLYRELISNKLLRNATREHAPALFNG